MEHAFTPSSFDLHRSARFASVEHGELGTQMAAPGDETHTEAPRSSDPQGRSRGRIAIEFRMTKRINDAVEKARHNRGDLSNVVAQALKGADLDSLTLIDFEKEGGSARRTGITIDRELHRMVKAVSKRRGPSINLLINSALAQFLQLPPSAFILLLVLALQHVHGLGHEAMWSAIPLIVNMQSARAAKKIEQGFMQRVRENSNLALRSS